MAKNDHLLPRDIKIVLRRWGARCSGAD